MSKADFKTETINPYSSFPAAGRNGGQRPVKVIPSISNTKAEIDAAILVNAVTGKSLGIGNLAPGGPECLEIESIIICSDKPARYYFSIQDTSLGGAGVPLQQSSIQVQPNVPSVMPINTIMLSGMTSGLYINKLFTDQGLLNLVTGFTGVANTTGGTLAATSYFARVTAVNDNGETDATAVLTRTTTGTTSSISYTWTGQKTARKYRVYIGLSTTTLNGYIETDGNINNIIYTGQALIAGTGPTLFSNMWQMSMWNEIRKKGVNVGYDLRGIAGSTTSTHRHRIISGLYDTDRSDCLIYPLGTNDAVQSVTVSTTKDNMKEFLTRALLNPMNLKRPVLAVTPLPINDNTSETNAVAIRTAYQQAVNEIKILYPDHASRLFLLDMVNGFDRTDLTNYKDNDGIHPSDKACESLKTTKIIPFLNSEQGIAFINFLK